MNSVPFLIAGFLFINPILEWGFRKFDLPAEKIQFWVMVTTGTTWVLALVYFLLIPTTGMVAAPAQGAGLLPSWEFSLDWISATLIFAAAGLLFFVILNRQQSPQTNARLAGWGGACLLGLEAYSAYTLGLLWTIVEGFGFLFSSGDQRVTNHSRKQLPLVLMRLSAPSALILYSLTRAAPEASLFSPADQPGAGLVLIGAGLLGFLGWLLSSRDISADQREGLPAAGGQWLPAILGLYLMIRGGMQLTAAAAPPTLLPLILTGLLLSTAVVGLLWGLSWKLWFFGGGLLVSVSAMLSSAEIALSWGLVMFLPGWLLWKELNQPEPFWPVLLLASAGLLPVPFLPAWVGVASFGNGGIGLGAGLGYGIMLGSVLIKTLKEWQVDRKEKSTYPLLGVIGASAVLISQLVISLRLGLIPSSRDAFNYPVTVWISFLTLIPILILGNTLPLWKNDRLIVAGSTVMNWIENAITGMIYFLDRLVKHISEMFEGPGGLVWALLIGLVLISLIGWGGG